MSSSSWNDLTFQLKQVWWSLMHLWLEGITEVQTVWRSVCSFCLSKAKLIFSNDFIWNLSESFEFIIEYVQQLPSSKMGINITSLFLQLLNILVKEKPFLRSLAQYFFKSQHVLTDKISKEVMLGRSHFPRPKALLRHQMHSLIFLSSNVLQKLNASLRKKCSLAGLH